MDELDKKIQSSTKAVRGNTKVGHDALLFLNTRYESFPVTIQQESLLSSNAKSVYNNLWLWAKKKESSSVPASLFPGYEWITLATGIKRGTIASCMTQLRLQRYITLHQKVRKENGQFVGNDYILNDEPMSLSDTLSLDKDYINFVKTNMVYHRHKRVQYLAVTIFQSLTHHIQNSDDPFRPSTHLEKIDARQQANQLIQERLYPEDINPELPHPEHYFGIPVQDYKDMVNKLHKENSVENNLVHEVNSVESNHVHKMNSVENSQVHKVNEIESLIEQQVHKVNEEVNEEVNGCSSGFIYNTTTEDTKLTSTDKTLVYPEFESRNEKIICELHIAKLPEEVQQIMLDELAGRMADTKQAKLANNIAYLKGWLIKEYNEGRTPFTSYIA